ALIDTRLTERRAGVKSDREKTPATSFAAAFTWHGFADNAVGAVTSRSISVLFLSRCGARPRAGMRPRYRRSSRRRCGCSCKDHGIGADVAVVQTGADNHTVFADTERRRGCVRGQVPA